jgi:hypothetical protein
LLIVVMGTVAADRPEPVAKSKTAPAGAQVKTKPGAAATPVAAAAQPKPKPTPDARATSLFRSAQNLEKVGKKPGAIGLYRDVMIRYPDTPEAADSGARLKALGGKVPDPSEIKPAPPPEDAKFTRVPKPKYASQAANRAALNEAVGGMVGGAAAQGGGGGGYGTQGGYR